ncbi:unnamed protein product [Cylicocyclus nassatus]|uniref:Uncharacterized protein n=1 Tax=Cylicocyclus nassatus TaxID=53992 RepID=A0AA36HEA3_CYLNA|nr:unnamed protein product [Cylicocyclus nassatus]
MHSRRHYGQHRRTVTEREHPRRLEEYEEQPRTYRDAVQAQQDEYYNNCFDHMKEYAAQVYRKKYEELEKKQAEERERFLKTMKEAGVPTAELPTPHGGEEHEEKPDSPFGDLRPVPQGPHSPLRTDPRPENVDAHRKAVALGLCSRFLPTVRKHCYERNTAKEYVKRCAAYFHVSVPVKQGELGKPIGVDVSGGVGPYYQQNQHVGVDYINGKVGTNLGIGEPFAGVGVNTGLGIPLINFLFLQ